MIRELIRKILGIREYIFIEASDGQMEVESFLFNKLDIVLLDIKVEILDGIEALRIIRQHFSEVRIKMFTDYNEEQLRLDTFHAGANRYISKDN